MAPNFLSKFVNRSPSNSVSSRSSVNSRSESPTPAHKAPSITIDSAISNSLDSANARPRRHTTVGSSSPSFSGSTESFPNVTVVPPSPRSVNYGSDLNDGDSTRSPPTLPDGPDQDEASSGVSSRRVPFASDLGSSLSTNTNGSVGAVDDAGLATPTPATTRTSFSDAQMSDRSLARPKSTGNLRKSPSRESPAALHARAQTAVDDSSPEKEKGRDQSRSRSPRLSLSKKASKVKLRNPESSRSRKDSTKSSKHDRAASVPSLPIGSTQSPPPLPPSVTVTEDGSLTTSPVSSEFPSGPPNTSVSSKYQPVSALPPLTANLLVPDNSDAASLYSMSGDSTTGRKKRGWTRKSRSGSGNSQTSPTSSTLSPSPKRKGTSNGIAGAIAASGLAMGMGMTPVPPVDLSQLPPTPGTSSSLASRGQRPRRSSDMSHGRRSRQASITYPASEFSDRDSYRSGEDDLLGGGSGLEDMDDDLDLDPDDIPVTGFAVASNKRNQDFHELFPSVPEGDYLIEDYGCALQREILIQGRLYVSENHLCFHANIFGWITDLCIPMYDVTALEKRMTAFVIPNAILVTTTQQKYTFTSFLSRDNTYDVIYNVWRLARPGASSALPSPRDSLDVPDGTSEVGASSLGAVSMGGVKPKVTVCDCARKGEHYSESAMECVLPGTPEKIYNLIFTSGFIKDFMTQDQNLIDLQISDWMPVSEGSKLLYRQMSYTKPLNGSIGPKSTKCELRDEMVHLDFDNYVTMLTTTRTPDVPSGGVFSVKTKTCITWASAVSTKVVVTTQVEWTGRSFIKGIIEKSAIDGQKQYHTDLENSMRKYIHEHQSEFIPEGVDVAAVESAEAEAAAATESPRLTLERPALSDAERRKSREYERNRRSIQWAYDTIEGAWKVGKQSAEGAIELIKDAWDQSSSTTILYFVIVFLLVSNVWTLFMVGKREEVGRRKEIRRTEERELWVQGVVTTLWDELLATKNAGGAGSGSWTPQQRTPAEWREEVAEMRAALDSIEQRVTQMRQSMEALD
ncbi:hypothetical protein DAEQUDRAFT_815349 [Daedalea quercina L-15889]|uniref:VASt domain-containing protein n=1 Tax=Daedalea quercina L-15889 TaxID=1314783 RepID=A0A165L4Z1_9APHY|nr:hypothetical protein DAEQUDRAFT_815349 [Daedalea quercina L-15889]